MVYTPNKREPKKESLFTWLSRERRFYLLKMIILLLPVILAISLRLTDVAIWVFFGSLLAYMAKRDKLK